MLFSRAGEHYIYSTPAKKRAKLQLFLDICKYFCNFAAIFNKNSIFFYETYLDIR